jgi:lysophospholipase L1-like esterase
LNVLIPYIAIGDYYVAVGDSITLGEGDDYVADDTSFDGRNIGGGYEPILNNLLTGAIGYPHTVVNEGVSGSTSAQGLAIMPEIIERNPAAKYFLILYGTNDSTHTVPSGMGLVPGNLGYNGSFKDIVQQIVSLIAGTGKMPILAKVPIAYGPCGSCTPFPDPDNEARNILIREYNVVIDELVAANGISVIPPDFYNYFRAHPEQMSDNYHPNGSGYQSMANLWFNALSN